MASEFKIGFLLSLFKIDSVSHTGVFIIQLPA
jgi:hypothetical protein